MSSEDEGTCSGVQHLPNDQPPHRCAPLFRWLFAPVFGETLLELVGFTRNLDKLRPVGRMWPAGLSIPAHQTLVEGMDKTDVSRFDSCITTNLCNANRWWQTTNMSNHLWKFRWSLVHFSYIISPSVLHPANTGPVCQIRLKPHFLAHEPWNRQLVIVRNLPVLVPPSQRTSVLLGGGQHLQCLSSKGGQRQQNCVRKPCDDGSRSGESAVQGRHAHVQRVRQK